MVLSGEQENEFYYLCEDAIKKNMSLAITVFHHFSSLHLTLTTDSYIPIKMCALLSIAQFLSGVILIRFISISPFVDHFHVQFVKTH